MTYRHLILLYLGEVVALLWFEIVINRLLGCAEH